MNSPTKLNKTTTFVQEGLSQFSELQVFNFSAAEQQFEQTCFNTLLSHVSSKQIGKILFLSLNGSRLYNTAIPQDPSAVQDVDMVGIFCAPVDLKLSLFKTVSVPQTITNNKQPTKLWVLQDKCNVDYYFHEIEKLCNMLLESNPTGVELLFGNENKLFLCDPSWLQLLQLKCDFLTRTLVKR